MTEEVAEYHPHPQAAHSTSERGIRPINVRLDDKLNRIKNCQSDEDNDLERDLIGYLILKQVARCLE